jgi:hypothetical protein
LILRPTDQLPSRKRSTIVIQVLFPPEAMPSIFIELFNYPVVNFESTQIKSWQERKDGVNSLNFSPYDRYMEQPSNLL